MNEGTAERLRRAFDEGFARAHQPADADQVDLLAIRVAGRALVVRVRDVEGVAPSGKLTVVPARARGFVGLVALRGRIVPVFALAPLLGYDAGLPSWIVIAGGDEPLALGFDALEGHRRVPVASIRADRGAPPDGLVRETVELDRELRGVVDVSAVLAQIRAPGARPAARMGATEEG